MMEDNYIRCVQNCYTHILLVWNICADHNIMDSAFMQLTGRENCPAMYMCMITCTLSYNTVLSRHSANLA